MMGGCWGDARFWVRWLRFVIQRPLNGAFRPRESGLRELARQCRFYLEGASLHRSASSM